MPEDGNRAFQKGKMLPILECSGLWEMGQMLSVISEFHIAVFRKRNFEILD
jgi:hypothetical protein